MQRIGIKLHLTRRAAALALSFLLLLFLLPLVSCSSSNKTKVETSAVTTYSETDNDHTNTAANANTQAPDETEDKTEMKTITVTVNGKTFRATLADTDAAREFCDMLPLTLGMDELNGNEKYFYLDESLTRDASVPASIRTGDLMLYGSSCVVLFYKDFSTSYSYTSLGHIEDASGLADALGRGSVTVTFERN